MSRKAFDVSRIGWIKATCETRHDHADLEHVRDLVMVAQLDFPAAQIGQIDRLCNDCFIAVLGAEVFNLCSAILFAGYPKFANDLERGRFFTADIPSGGLPTAPATPATRGA